MRERPPKAGSAAYVIDPPPPGLPTAHPLWPAFVEAIRANGGHPDLVTCPRSYRNHGRLLWCLFVDGSIAGAEAKRKGDKK